MLFKAERAFAGLKVVGLSTSSRWAILLVYFVALAIVLVAGLWPFDFHPKNQVVRLNGRNGVLFNGHGMIFGALDLPPMAASAESRQPTTIELLIRPFSEPKDYLPQYFTVLDENLEDDFFIGQWRSELVLRTRIRGHAALSRYREVGVRGTFSNDKESLIAITSGDAGTIIYQDGLPAKILPRFFLIAPDKTGRRTLLLGNSSTGKAGMKGMISGIAIYDRELSASQINRSYDSWKKDGRTILGKDEGLDALYLFNERSGGTVRNHIKPGQDLAIPEAFKPLKRIILALDWKRFGFNHNFLSDVALNVIGFSIFSFIQGVAFLSVLHSKRSRALLLALICGSALSMIIELIQVCLPGRNSDLTDWICNTIGTLAAVLILQKLHKPARPA